MDNVKVVNDMDIAEAESSASAVLESSNSGNAVESLPLEALHSIFKLLPFRDLLSCREVNSKWNSAARDPLRKQCTPIPFSASLPMPKRHEMLDTFTKCLLSSAHQGEDFPMTKFHLDLNSRDKFLNDQCYFGSVQEFVRSISPIVTELSLEFRLGSLKKSNDYLVINKWNRDFPNLKFLTLVVVADDRIFRTSTDPKRTALRLTRSILDNAPKLQNVEMKFRRRVNLYMSLPRLISGLGDTLCYEKIGDPLKLNLLTSLSIKSALTGADWNKLKDLGLKLKTFEICFGYKAGDSDALKLFLEKQSETLTTLKISYYHGNNDKKDALVQFPSLPHLKELKIKEKYFSTWIDRQRHELKFLNVSYSTQLPALQKLSLLNAPHAWTAFILSADIGNQRLDTLETLSLPRGWGYHDAVLRTSQLFPNVKKLKLHVCKGVSVMMKHVYEFMPRIEDLELCLLEPGNYCIDDLITGLSPRHCEKILEAPSTSWKNALESMKEGNNVKTMASLENLRVLRIYREFKQWVGKPEFNEISGVVLKQMKKLEFIDFGIRKFPPVISRALRSDLEKHLRIVDRLPLYRGSSIAELRTAITEDGNGKHNSNPRLLNMPNRDPWIVEVPPENRIPDIFQVQFVPAAVDEIEEVVHLSSDSE